MFKEPLKQISREDLKNIRRDGRILTTTASPRGWHRIQTFLECPQKYAWKYRYGVIGYDYLERVEWLEQQRIKEGDDNDDKIPLIRGTLIHLGLAQYYSRMREVQKGGDPELYLAPAEAIRLMCEIQGAAYLPHCEEITECVHGYIRYWAPREKLKILFVEELLESKIGSYRYTGRLDLIVEDPQGRIWAYDHKSTGRIEKKHAIFYSISGQLFGYRWLAKQTFGTAFAGLRINLIQHANGDFKYQRPVMDPSPYLFGRFVPNILEAEQRIEALDASGRSIDEWPVAMNEMTCFGRYGVCEHIEKCQWGPHRVPK